MKTAAQIAFLGGGNMARALIQGLLRQGYSASQLRVGEPLAPQRELLRRDFGLLATADNGEAIAGAAVVVLAIKPQQMNEVLIAARPALGRTHPLLLSIAAGLQIADIAASAPGLPIVRAMPNRAALVGAGATALYAGAEVSAAARALAENILDAAGSVVWVQRESDLDIVTALSGGGAAYFFLLAERLAAAATALGLDGETARVLATQTLRGAGALAAGAESLAEQREAITSRGGTTEAALAALEQGGFDKLITAALSAATRHGAALAAEFGRSGHTQLRPPGAHS
jgi:pyrroline-5-carboxylate reductase